MMERPAAEFTVISIDNARRVFWSQTLKQAQVEAAKLYCETVLKCNPDNLVTIVTMSVPSHGQLVPPTNDIKTLKHALEYVRCDYKGGAEFDPALYMACQIFSRSPNHMKRRLLMFVGGPIHLSFFNVSSYGKQLKDIGVALDVFNLYHLKDPPTISDSIYHYARKELETLVATANDRGSSRIVDTVESSILVDLSGSTLKEHLHYLGQKAAADGKNKSAADEKNKSVEELQIRFVKPKRFHDENTKSAAEMMNMVKQVDVAAGRKKKVRKALNDENTKSAAEMMNMVKQVDVAAGRKKKVRKALKERNMKRPRLVTDLKPGENEKVKLEAA